MECKIQVSLYLDVQLPHDVLYMLFHIKKALTQRRWHLIAFLLVNTF
jgi:hypothetical protein